MFVGLQRVERAECTRQQQTVFHDCIKHGYPDVCGSLGTWKWCSHAGMARHGKPWSSMNSGICTYTHYVICVHMYIMCMYVYVYIYIYIHTHVYVCMYIHMYTHIWLYMYVYIYNSVYHISYVIYHNIYIYIYIHTHTYTYVERERHSRTNAAAALRAHGHEEAVEDVVGALASSPRYTTENCTCPPIII